MVVAAVFQQTLTECTANLARFLAEAFAAATTPAAIGALSERDRCGRGDAGVVSQAVQSWLKYLPDPEAKPRAAGVTPVAAGPLNRPGVVEVNQLLMRIVAAACG